MLDFLSNLDNPQAYECRVWDYNSTHSRLIIRVNKLNQFVTDDEAFFLLLLGVKYFEGPLHWRGINFLEGNKSECQRLLHQTTVARDLIAEHAKLGTFTLFTLESEDVTVRIVAESVERMAINSPSQ